MDRLVAECLLRNKAYQELQWLCDNVGGRTSGAPSGNQAEEWAERLLKEWGCDRVWFEELRVPVWRRGRLTLEAVAPASWRLIALAHGHSPRSASLEAPVVDANHGEKADYASLDARGKIVLSDEGVAEGHRALHRTEKLAIAIEAGAAGFLMLSSAPGGLPRTGVCHRGESPIPSIGISQEDGERLKRLIKAGQSPLLRIEMRNEMQTGTARNVIGEIAGAESPEEYVMAGAHLDCWDISQGATDNGLGTAIVLEAARALASLGQRPRRSMRFALWAAEEVGILGSKEYVRSHEDELERIACVMNFDMTGDPYGYWCPGRKKKSALLDFLGSQLSGLGMKPDYAHKASLHSDHQYFMLKGVPVVGLMAKLEGQGGHFYHSVGDTFEKVHLPSLCRCSAVASVTLWAFADEVERTYQRLDGQQIEAMIEEADLREALSVEGL